MCNHSSHANASRWRRRLLRHIDPDCWHRLMHGRDRLICLPLFGCGALWPPFGLARVQCRV
jgi:hypothetical protein